MQLPYLRQTKLMEFGRVGLVRAACICFCIVAAEALHASPPGKIPSFEEIAQLVLTDFTSQPDYRAGDILRQSQVEGVLKNVAASGWKVDKAGDVVEMALPDSSFLARELSTPAGKRFMRKVGAHRGGYAHLDRLSTIPRGQKIVRDLIKAPGGDKLLTYMATTQGGHNLGQKMAGVRGGVDINKPTKRIYTADDLLAVLTPLHEKAAKQAAGR